VQPGDTLLGIAMANNTPWEVLATHNRLGYPYFIYPGDVLQLP
jgi:LysM repeat protein